MVKIILVIGILSLFIGASIVSSSDNILKTRSVDYSTLESVGISEKNFPQNTTWYMFVIDGFEGTGFYAFYPNGTYRFGEWDGLDFFSGGTWTNDGRYLCCLFENGTLYDINTETFEACVIGDGGVSLNGLSYNPVNEKLFGASGKDFYEIDINTGNQTHIGSFGIDNFSYMIAIAFDFDGICYGWDVKSTGESYLYRINTSTGKAAIVGGMDLTLIYAQDGAFDFVTDTLYLAAYKMFTGGCLLECDKETGECYFLEYFQWEATAHAISYFDNEPPVTTHSFDPPNPNGENGWYISNVTVTLDARDENSVEYTYFRINGGNWLDYIEPFILSIDGNDILIEYYSVDYSGNEEDVKSVSIDIDQTPPYIKLTYEVVGGNRVIGWDIEFTAIVYDNTSDVNGRVEFYFNNELQEVIDGPGPDYVWTLRYWPIPNAVIRATGCNGAGLCASDEIINPRTRTSTSFHWLLERFPMLERLLILIRTE
jgi:hypothetical protein